MPWYVDIVNFMVSGIFPPKSSTQQKKKPAHEVRFYVWDEPYLFKQGSERMVQRCEQKIENRQVLEMCYASPYGGHHGAKRTTHKIPQSSFFGPTLFKDATIIMKNYDVCQRAETISRRHEMPFNNILKVEIFNE